MSLIRNRPICFGYRPYNNRTKHPHFGAAPFGAGQAGKAKQEPPQELAEYQDFLTKKLHHLESRLGAYNNFRKQAEQKGYDEQSVAAFAEINMAMREEMHIQGNKYFREYVMNNPGVSRKVAEQYAAQRVRGELQKGREASVKRTQDPEKSKPEML